MPFKMSNTFEVHKSQNTCTHKKSDLVRCCRCAAASFSTGVQVRNEPRSPKRIASAAAFPGRKKKIEHTSSPVLSRYHRLSRRKLLRAEFFRQILSRILSPDSQHHFAGSSPCDTNLATRKASSD